jgi:hypothetical protein
MIGHYDEGDIGTVPAKFSLSRPTQKVSRTQQQEQDHCREAAVK